MLTEKAVLQQVCKGNQEAIGQVQPQFFLDTVNRQIAERAFKLGDVSFSLVRSAINQDKTNLFKGKLHDRLSEIENEVYGFYPEMCGELVESWKSEQIKRISHQLAKIGTEYCTLEDAQSHVEQLSEVLTHGSTLDEIKEHESLSESILSRKKEDTQASFLSLKSSLLADIFDNYLIPRLYVISGFPSMGKNILADNLVYDLCQRYPCLYFTFDNSAEETTMTILSIASKVEYKKIEGGEIGEVESRHLDERELIKDRLFLCDRKKTAKQIKALIARAVKQYGVKFVLIDYFTNIKLPFSHDTTRQYEDAANTFKTCCSEYGVAIIVISQLNDAGEVKWCRGLFEEAYFLVKMDGERSSNFRKVTVEKYKKGALKQVNVEYNAPVGGLAYARIDNP